MPVGGGRVGKAGFEANQNKWGEYAWKPVGQ